MGAGSAGPTSRSDGCSVPPAVIWGGGRLGMAWVGMWPQTTGGPLGVGHRPSLCLSQATEGAGGQSGNSKTRSVRGSS